MGPPANLRPLPRSFYDRSVLQVARDLLGCFVVAREVVVRLTEVEAYGGTDDPASHAFRGPTRRNAPMFGEAGHLYVYFTYGMHHCANVVAGRPGDASAVLLRAGQVVSGVDVVRKQRPQGAERDLARGPALLAKALGLDLIGNGVDVTQRNDRLWLAAGRGAPNGDIAAGPRVGIRVATELPWRFCLLGEATVSQFRPASPRTGR